MPGCDIAWRRSPSVDDSSFATLEIDYAPQRHLVETKSLKLYLLAYRNLGIFYENAVNRILEDVAAACRPVRATVIGEFNPRGGMSSIVEANFPREIS